MGFNTSAGTVIKIVAGKTNTTILNAGKSYTFLYPNSFSFVACALITDYCDQGPLVQNRVVSWNNSYITYITNNNAQQNKHTVAICYFAIGY